MGELNPRDRLWTVRDVAAYLGLKEKTVYAKAGRGEIPSVLVGRLRRFIRGDILAWVVQRKEG